MSERPTNMKTIGILGGMSDQATIEYYRQINDQVNRQLGGREIAETLIQSVNFGNIEYFVRQQKWQEAREYLQRKAVLAEQGGADLLICATNTMHKVLDNIETILQIPFVHIMDPVGEAICAAGIDTVVLLGTKPVMHEDYMKQRLYEKYAINCVVPDEQGQREVDRIIFDELVKGDVLPASKQVYVQICQQLAQQGAQGVILGCTEICLLLKPEDLPTMQLFDTTALHTKAAVKMALNH